VWNLILGIILIGIFFVLFFMLKSGYDYNKKKEEGKSKKDS